MVQANSQTISIFVTLDATVYEWERVAKIIFINYNTSNSTGVEMQRFVLEGCVKYSHGHDCSKTQKIEEHIDTEGIKEAIEIARAMIQSKKLQIGENCIESMSANLRLDYAKWILWTITLRPAQTKLVVISPEHFEETFSRLLED